jgi:predicted N-acyltransferase
MTKPEFSDLDAHIVRCITDIPANDWDALSAGKPFQSHRWYAFGERAMADCPSFTIIVSHAGKAVGRGTFWLVRNEPVPGPAAVQKALASLLRIRPLLICRSPLANLSGLVLPEGDLRYPVLERILAAAGAITKEHNCSFTICDFIDAGELHASWPPGYRAGTVADPGTWMKLEWGSFSAYLEARGKKDRQHYKRSLREAEKLGIQVHRRMDVTDSERALELVHQVEQKHGAAPNPWTRNLLENLPAVSGTFLEATIGGRLVGCGALLYDGGAQMAAALGLAEGVPYVYFALVYASLQEALERNVRLLRWGSGAYDFKKQLGFELEQNNHIMASGNGTIPITLNQLFFP